MFICSRTSRMEVNTIEEVQVEAVPNQFWGAVKIFTEKPHIINRRICGTANLWIGVCEENFCREKLINSLIKTIESDCCDKLNNDEACSIEITDCSEIHKSKIPNCNTDKISLIQKKLEHYCFKSLSSFNDDKSKNDFGELERKKSDPETESQDMKFSTCQEGKCSIPWEYLTKESNSVAVIRKVLPKQVDKFVSAAEVILLGM